MLSRHRNLFKKYLCNEEPDISITLNQSDISFERTKAAREDALEGLSAREYSDEYLDLIDRLSQRVAFYHLSCNMDPQAAKTAYDAMSQ